MWLHAALGMALNLLIVRLRTFAVAPWVRFSQNLIVLDRKNKVAREKSEKLEFDAQEDIEVPICFCGSLAQVVTEMTTLILCTWCQSWWNGDHSSMPAS